MASGSALQGSAGRESRTLLRGRSGEKKDGRPQAAIFLRLLSIFGALAPRQSLTPFWHHHRRYVGWFLHRGHGLARLSRWRAGHIGLLGGLQRADERLFLDRHFEGSSESKIFILFPVRLIPLQDACQTLAPSGN